MECRLPGETEVLGENLPQRHFCPSRNPTWPDSGLNPGSRGGKPANNRLSCGAASQKGYFSLAATLNLASCLSRTFQVDDVHIQWNHDFRVSLKGCNIFVGIEWLRVQIVVVVGNVKITFWHLNRPYYLCFICYCSFDLYQEVSPTVSVLLVVSSCLYGHLV
jgi:hypothetical protein